MLEFEIIPSDTNRKVYKTLVIKNYAYNNPSMKILFDTGAYLPVWTDGIANFIDTFAQCRYLNIKAILSGFGVSYEVADVYGVPVFVLRDDKGNWVKINNLYIVVTKRDFSFQMILSFPTLEKMNYHYLSYTNKNNIYKQIDPKFRIYPHRDTYYMSPNIITVNNIILNRLEEKYEGISSRIKIGDRILDNVYTFTQE